MKKKICWLFGHKITDYNDSGYKICERCQKHEYYDRKTWMDGIPFHKAYWFIRANILKIKALYDIKFNNKLPF